MFHRPKTEDQSQGQPQAEPQSSPPPAASNDVAAKPSAPQQPRPLTQPQPASSHTAPPPARTETHRPESIDKTTDKGIKPMTADKPIDNATPSNSGEGFSRPLDIPGTAGFQRPGASGPAAPQTPRMPGSSYAPGNFGGSPYGATAAAGAASNTPSSEARPNARRLVVGEGITMSGEIESCDTLIVEGTVEAALKGASILEIAETGVFYGTVEIDECTIAGRFEGDITVNGRLTVKSNGSITGSIAYKELAVEAGATVDGKLSPTSANAKKSERKDGKSKSSGKPQGNELPFGGHATAAE